MWGYKGGCEREADLRAEVARFSSMRREMDWIGMSARLPRKQSRRTCIGMFTGDSAYRPSPRFRTLQDVYERQKF